MGIAKTLKGLFGGSKTTDENAAVESRPITSIAAEATAQNNCMPETESKKEETALPKAEQSVAAESNDSIATTMLINKSVLLKNGEVDIDGVVRGRLSVGDKVWIIAPGLCVGAIIAAMENRGNISVKHIENGPAHITLKSDEIKGRVDHAVLTNIVPPSDANPPKSLENPFLTGLMWELPELANSQEYTNLLFFAVAHSSFLIPVTFSKAPVADENGKMSLPPDTQINFQLLSSEQGPAVGVYTDERALALAPKQSVEEGKTPNTWMMPFQDAIALNEQVKGLGIVVNAFGPQPALNLTNNHIQGIVGSEGYKHEFGDGKYQSPLQKSEE